VNGIRAVLKKGFFDLLTREKPDVFCAQETKAHPDVVEADWLGYEANWNWADKKGYSGVLTLSREKPLSVSRGIGISAHDTEGRVLTTEFKEFYLVNVYVPNSQRELERLSYRQEWDRDFLAYLKKLEKKKPVVFCGDLNVAHMPIDLARPKDNVKNHGFTGEERAGFDSFMSAGFVDTFRAIESGAGHYTWWSQMNKARDRNIGWRIDYFLCSKVLHAKLKHACIYKDVMGSDHCPVGVEFHP
jgi:exodeoxyribonuclease III